MRGALPHTSDERDPSVRARARQALGVLRYTRRAFALVWTTHRGLAVALGALTLLAGLVPGAIAYVGKLIVDAVVLASQEQDAAARDTALSWVVVEALLVAFSVGVQRGISICDALLRALLGQRVNEMILEKAATLELRHFEDSEFYDKLTRARREASTRPLSLVRRAFGLLQNAVSLTTYGVLLLDFSPWAAAILLLAAVPQFLVETKFSGDAFRLFKWRSPEAREQLYLESLLAREDYAKEVQLFQLAPLFLARYRAIFKRLYSEDRALTLRRNGWGYLVGLLGSAAFYGTYGWIAVEAVRSAITLGDMTMYLVLFRQGQSAVSSSLSSVAGMVDDNLYLSTLYEFLEQRTEAPSGAATWGARPGDGVRFEGVSFTYPGAAQPALDGVDLHLPPGGKLALVGENGSGKTTLIKLLTRLYEPTAGRILLDGTPLREWSAAALRARIGVIFQDFVHYQLQVGENIGVGDVAHIDDEVRWARAAEKGMAAPFVEALPHGYHAQLGRWFKDGQELSGGQWQKIALSRVFMRESADILVLDEPTASMDAAAEFQVFERIRAMTADQMAILIAHRFSTVRMADTIAVLQSGRIVERGSHAELMQLDGLYARLFSLQAAGYK